MFPHEFPDCKPPKVKVPKEKKARKSINWSNILGPGLAAFGVIGMLILYTVVRFLS